MTVVQSVLMPVLSSYERPRFRWGVDVVPIFDEIAPPMKRYRNWQSRLVENGIGLDSCWSCSLEDIRRHVPFSKRTSFKRIFVDVEVLKNRFPNLEIQQDSEDSQAEEEQQPGLGAEAEAEPEPEPVSESPEPVADSVEPPNNENAEVLETIFNFEGKSFRVRVYTDGEERFLKKEDVFSALDVRFQTDRHNHLVKEFQGVDVLDMTSFVKLVATSKEKHAVEMLWWVGDVVRKAQFGDGGSVVPQPVFAACSGSSSGFQPDRHARRTDASTIYAFLIDEVNTVARKWPEVNAAISPGDDPKDYLVIKIGKTRNPYRRFGELKNAYKKEFNGSLLHPLFSVEIPIDGEAALAQAERQVHCDFADDRVRIQGSGHDKVDGRTEIFVVAKNELEDLFFSMETARQSVVSEFKNTPRDENLDRVRELENQLTQKDLEVALLKQQLEDKNRQIEYREKHFQETRRQYDEYIFLLKQMMPEKIRRNLSRSAPEM